MQWHMHKVCANVSAADPLHQWLFKSNIDCNSRQEIIDGYLSTSCERDIAVWDQQVPNVTHRSQVLCHLAWCAFANLDHAKEEHYQAIDERVPLALCNKVHSCLLALEAEHAHKSRQLVHQAGKQQGLHAIGVQADWQVRVVSLDLLCGADCCCCRCPFVNRRLWCLQSVSK